MKIIVTIMGIFNRQATHAKLARNKSQRSLTADYGVNPCCEVNLLSKQFCNLTEVVIRATDTLEDIRRKFIICVILGTFQSSLTNIHGLRNEWVKNTKDEALLGVSLTGIMDHPFMNGSQGHQDLKMFLAELRQLGFAINSEWADKLGINHSKAITSVKPSGSVSQLVGSASGIHARHSPYYIRRVRADEKDPLMRMMRAKGVPCEDDVTSESVKVFSFPIKSPEGSVFRDDRTAIEQLELWLIYDRYYTDHKPSITVTVKEDEWFEVGAWVHKHFNDISGVSFLPHSGHIYRQAPYEEISKEKYYELLAEMPKDIDWSLLSKYENEDQTNNVKELACSGGACENVDLVN